MRLRPTINSELMNQLSPLQLLQNHKTADTPMSHVMPRMSGEISVGQIRSMLYKDTDLQSDRRFVLVTSMTSNESMIVQVTLIGTDLRLTSKNDVLLLESERPTPYDIMIQTDLRFPVLRSDLGAVFSVLEPATVTLLTSMNNYSGRDISRSGTHKNDADVIRQDYLREELQTVRCLSSNAFIAMQGPVYKGEQVKLLDAGNHSSTIRQAAQSESTFHPLPPIARPGHRDEHSKQEVLEFLRQRKATRGTKEKVTA
jgi:hypothetical protein